MGSCRYAFGLSCSATQISYKPQASISSSPKPFVRKFPRIPSPLDVKKMLKQSSLRLIDGFVDQMFQFVVEPYLPSQSNFSPVEEIGEAVVLTDIHGSIPDDFPEGVYLRNGGNPIYGGFQSAISIFGKSSEVWVEGEGMLHAIYLKKDASGNRNIVYNNKYVQTATYKLEKERTNPGFLPASEGNSLAVISGIILNKLRFGKVTKNFSNTNIFENCGKYYTTTENDMPEEIDIHTLEALGTWDEMLQSWNRPFTSHPKRAPETGELVTIGFSSEKPYFVLGVISESSKLVHKVDLKFERTTFIHEIGVTRRYNVILDFPITFDSTRLLMGGSLIKFEKESYARIGIMSRYGDAESVKWFGVEACSSFHIINCHEEGDEVIVMACRAEDSMIPGPDLGLDKFDWFSRGFKRTEDENGNSHDDEGYLFARPYEWRLNTKTGEVKEKFITRTDEYALEFPFINQEFTGLRNKYAYFQVVDSNASSIAAMAKYGGLAKMYLEDTEEFRKVEYHMFPENTFCSGSAFVIKDGAVEEDDGWLITFVHDETTNVSEVYIIDAKNISNQPVAKIELPCRVPYGFHGAFMQLRPQCAN